MFRNVLAASVPFAVVLYLSGGCTQANRPVSTDQSGENTRIVEQYWPNGKLQLRRQVLTDPDGVLIDHGTYTRWHDNGRKEYEATFVRGQLDGLEITWHKNGRKWTETQYVQGRKHGPRFVWNDGGVKIKEEHYHNGQPHGVWTVWKSDGKIKAQQTFEHGTPQP
jgi:antitoxin component YwqK of YwqJK toxin-antitoxin module